MVLRYRKVLSYNDPYHKDRYWEELLRQSALVPAAPNEYKPEPHLNLFHKKDSGSRFEDYKFSSPILANSAFTPFDIVFSARDLGLEVLPLALTKPNMLKSRAYEILNPAADHRSENVLEYVSSAREQVEEIHPIPYQTPSDSKLKQSNNVESDDSVARRDKVSRGDVSNNSKPDLRIREIPTIEILEVEDSVEEKNNDLPVRPSSAPPTINYDWEEFLSPNFVEFRDESEKAKTHFATPPEIANFVPAQALRPKAQKTKVQNVETHFAEESTRPEAEIAKYFDPKIVAEPIGDVKKIQSADTEPLRSNAAIPEILESVKSEPIIQIDKLPVSETSFLNVKRELGLKDLIQAIYNNDFDRIDEILKIKEYLRDEIIMQSGKMIDEENLNDAELLCSNEQFYSWSRSEISSIEADKNSLEKEWNIFNIDEDDSGFAQFKFVRIRSTGKKKLVSVKYNVSNKSLAPSLDLDFNISDLRYIKPVHLAAILGHKEALFSLMKHGADFHEPDSKGLTPLHYGVLTGNIPVVALLSASSDVQVGEKSNYQYKEAISTLELAASLGMPKIFDCLRRNQSEKVSFDFLDRAIFSNSKEMIRTILEDEVFIKRYSKRYPEKILYAAIKLGDAEILEKVMELYQFKGKAEIFDARELQDALLYAAKAPDIFKVATLIKDNFGEDILGALLRATDASGNTPMHILAEHNPFIYDSFESAYSELGLCEVKVKRKWWQKLLCKSAKKKLSEILNEDGLTSREVVDESMAYEIIEETHMMGGLGSIAETAC